MGKNTCDWCEAEAVYVNDKDGCACEQHKADLEKLMQTRLHQSGNPFAGEAAEILIEQAKL